MKKLSALITLVLLLMSPGLAQEKRTLLLLPFEISGNFRPVSQDSLSTLLQAALAKKGPMLQVSLSDQRLRMMSPEEAARIGKEAGVQYVLYGDIRFRKELKGASLTGVNTEGYPGGTGVKQGFADRYMLTLAAVGHGRVVDVATGQIVLERPEILLESEYTGALDGSSRMEKLENSLAERCIQQFCDHLVDGLKADADEKKAKTK